MSRFIAGSFAALAYWAHGEVEGLVPSPNIDSLAVPLPAGTPAPGSRSGDEVEVAVPHEEVSGEFFRKHRPSDGHLSRTRETEAAAFSEGAKQISTTAGGVVEDLWDGLDFGKNAFTFSNLASVLPGEEDAQPEAHVQVLGLQNSGTDLLNALLYINFGYRLEYYAHPADQPNHRNGIWRHADIKQTWVKDREHITELGRDDGATLRTIIVVRNPMSWLRAMRSNPPEEFKSCAAANPDENGKSWLVEHCTHPYPGGKTSSVEEIEYPNLAAVWNQWNDGYFNASRFGFQRNIIVTYESIVGQPEVSLNRIAKFLNVKPPMWNLLPDVSSSRGQKVAQGNIRTKGYSQTLTSQERATGCNFLNMKLMEFYGYDDCIGEQNDVHL